MLGIWSQVPTLGQQEFLQWTISQVPPPLCRLVDWVIDWLVGGWLSVGQTTTCGVSSPRSPLPTFHHGFWELNSHHLAWLLAPLPAELSHWPLFSLLTFFFCCVLFLRLWGGSFPGSRANSCLPSGQVYSGYRFILTAREKKLPIAILNIGPTRSDDLACLKLDSRCGELLPLIDPQWPRSGAQSLEMEFPLSPAAKGKTPSQTEGSNLV